MKRKLISSLLCLCMLISLLPVAAFAGETPADGAKATLDVIAAPLGKNTTAGAYEGYADSYKIGTPTEGTDKVITVPFEATNLKMHKTTDEKTPGPGYYVGVGIIVPEGATVYTGWEAPKENSTYKALADAKDSEVKDGNKTYSTFYFDLSPNNQNNKSQSTDGYVAVKVAGATGSEGKADDVITTYKLEFKKVELAKPSIVMAGFNANGNTVDKVFFDELKALRGSGYTPAKLDSEKNTFYTIIDGIDYSGNSKYVVKLSADKTSETIYTYSSAGEYDTLGLRIAYATADQGAALPENFPKPAEGKTTDYTFAIYAANDTGEATGDPIDSKTITVGNVTLNAGTGTLADRTNDFKADPNKDGVTITESKTAKLYAQIPDDGIAVADLGVKTAANDVNSFKNWEPAKLTKSVLTSTAQWVTTPTTLTVAAAANETELFTKTAGDLQQNIKATVADSNKITVTGDSKYISNWTQAYAGDQANGHFVALKLTQTPASATVTVPSPTTTPATKTLDPDGIWVVRLENFKDLSKVEVVVTPKGGTKDDAVTYTLNLSNIVKEALGSVAVTEGTGESAVESTIAATVEQNTIKLSGLMTTPENLATGTTLNLAYKSNLNNAIGGVTPATVAIKQDATSKKAVCDTKEITVMGVKYALDVTGIEFSPIKIEVAAPEVSADKINPTDKDTVEKALKANTTKTEGTGTLTATPDAKKELTDVVKSVENKLPGATKVEDVKVQVSLKIEAVDYTAPAKDTSATLKLDIVPIYTVVTKKDGSPVTGTDGKAITGELTTKSFDNSMTITVTLPSGFVTDENTQVVTKHYNKDGKTVKEWLRTRVAETANNSGIYTASFDAASFSEYEIVADTRDYEVNFNAGDGKCDIKKDKFTPADIGKKSFPTATPNDITKEFKGWAKSNTATAGEFSGVLTDEQLTALKGVTNLYAVYGTKSTGGGGGVSSNVTIDRPTNGKISVTPTAPSKGATVTINLTPDTGYAVGTVTVTDKDGKAVELTKVSDTKYTFTMPDGKVKVAATFTKVDTPPATGFTDVAADAYYADAVKWAVDKGITNGLTATTFGPNNSCTRAQMVTFLWRGAGSPAPTGTNSFTDVASGEYYYNAVLWAVEKGITKGTTDTTFSPNATVNRAQTVTFLYRYAGSPAATGDNAFTDVAAGQYYTDAVKWAVAEEITNGTSATTFAPNNNCTRGQIVTFLYRQMAE